MKQKKGIKNKMWLSFIIIAIVIVGIAVFFHIPYSKTKAEFNKMAAEQMADTPSTQDVFTVDDLEALPLPLKRYFAYSGFIGTPKMSSMKAVFHDVDFVMSPDKPAVKIDYTQYNFVKEPVRLAFIDSTLFGIPFQGLDSYVDGIGSMKGVLAKQFTLFDQKGEAMDKASLVTVLAESLIIPHVALQNYMTWEEIDDTHAKAIISYYGISASGIFTFSENGEILSFITNDRAVVSTDGTTQQVPWSAIFNDYKTINGIKQPTKLQAVWHYDSGDLIYFDSKDLVVEYHYK